MKPEKVPTAIRQQNLLGRMKTLIGSVPSNDDLHSAYPEAKADRIAQHMQVAIGRLELAKLLMENND
jgi:hypothetical protein